MTFIFKYRTKSLHFKYSNFHKFCFYILNKTMTLYPINKRRDFDARTIIKMKVEDIKAKFMKIAIVKKQTYCS